MELHDIEFKFILLGDSGVGKSSILLSFCESNFDESFISTIGIDFKIKTLNIFGKKIKLSIWDTAGQCRYRTISKAFIRGSHGVIFVYDVTQEHSFNNIVNWINLLHQEVSDHDNIPKILVGNKIDLEGSRIISSQQGKIFADSNNILFMETSSKSGENIENIFNILVRNCLEKYSDIELKSENLITISESNKKSCCHS